ncbi:MAG: RnfABCDGE type electron transport complex subunit B [Actinobacteria bacterium]|nr:MAG: RnfABCDGE type electron transport complex subunit B [Actinomycetota bacterium]
MGGTGLVFGSILAVASKRLAVEIDPRVDAVLGVLPGSNCGACGYPGCEGAAEAMASGDGGTGLCVAGGQETANHVAHVLGLDAEAVGVRKVAVLNCNGGCTIAKAQYDYDGVSSCRAAHALHGGPLACERGCIGFGDCVASCPFDAMKMGDDRRPAIDEGKCTGCGVCVTACPHGREGLLSLVEETSPIVVACNSHDAPKMTRAICKSGCIACKACEKVCEHDAIEVRDNLAVVDYEKCTGCGKCVEKCAPKCIVLTSWGEKSVEVERETQPTAVRE